MLRVAGVPEQVLCGHLLGDVVWCSTALIAIVGAREVGSSAFDVLGVLSGVYLFWLGWRAIRTQRRNGDAPRARRGTRSGMALCSA